MSEQILRSLGQIEGRLKGIESTQSMHTGKLDGIDGRLRKVETRAAGTGALAGGIVAVGVQLLVNKITGGGA